MASHLALQQAVTDMSSSHMAGLARSLTASQRVLTTLQDAHKSPKSPLGPGPAGGADSAGPGGAPPLQAVSAKGGDASL